MTYSGIFATSSDRGWVMLLLALGAAVQLAGVVLVVVQLFRRRRDARSLAGDILRFPGSDTPALQDEQAAMVQVQRLVPVVRRLLQPDRLQVIGVVLVVVGILLDLAGGIWSLYLGPSLLSFGAT